MAEALLGNFRSLLNVRPVLATAAEAVHQGFQVYLSEDVKANKQRFALAGAMGIAAHASWTDGIVLCAWGSGDTGFSALRRAIEFSCYAAKVA